MCLGILDGSDLLDGSHIILGGMILISCFISLTVVICLTGHIYSAMQESYRLYYFCPKLVK